MGTRNTLISSMIAKGGNGNMSSIQTALLNEGAEAKKTDKKKPNKK